jgi:hypothetical protein
MIPGVCHVLVLMIMNKLIYSRVAFRLTEWEVCVDERKDKQSNKHDKPNIQNIQSAITPSPIFSLALSRRITRPTRLVFSNTVLDPAPLILQMHSR